MRFCKIATGYCCIGVSKICLLLILLLVLGVPAIVRKLPTSVSAS